MKLSIIKTTMTAIALTTFVAGPVAAEGRTCCAYERAGRLKGRRLGSQPGGYRRH